MFISHLITGGDATRYDHIFPDVFELCEGHRDLGTLQRIHQKLERVGDAVIKKLLADQPGWIGLFAEIWPEDGIEGFYGICVRPECDKPVFLPWMQFHWCHKY